MNEVIKGDWSKVIEAEKPGRVKRLRDSHHLMARLFAMGLRPGEVAKAAGYSLSWVSVISAGPAFQELVAKYRENATDVWKETVAEDYTYRINRIRDLSSRQILDQLEDAEQGDQIPIRVLAHIHADAADRTGFPKQSVAVNHNVNWTTALEKAIQRSQGARGLKVIEDMSEESSPPAPPRTGGTGPAPQPVPLIKRRF